MSFWDLIATNLGMSIATIILILVLISTIIIFAKSFHIGMMILTLEMAGLFMWFYAAGWNWVRPLIIMLMSIAVLTLTLITVSREKNNTGVV